MGSAEVAAGCLVVEYYSPSLIFQRLHLRGCGAYIISSSVSESVNQSLLLVLLLYLFIHLSKSVVIEIWKN